MTGLELIKALADYIHRYGDVEMHAIIKNSDNKQYSIVGIDEIFDTLIISEDA